jgi:hypothetical protein
MKKKRTNAVGSDNRKFRITAFMYDDVPRHIFQHVETLKPSVAISLYESWLFRTCSSYNSVKKYLSDLVYLYTWADEMGVDVEDLLLNGHAPTPAEIRNFTMWLQKARWINKAKNDLAAITTYNGTLSTTCAIFCWFNHGNPYLHLNSSRPTCPHSQHRHEGDIQTPSARNSD